MLAMQQKITHHPTHQSHRLAVRCVTKGCKQLGRYTGNLHDQRP